MKKPHVCPWWLCFAIDNPLRRLVQNPGKIIAPFVHEGGSVLDLGPAMGYFTLAMASRVGEKGVVFAVDVQPQMIRGLMARAKRAGLAQRIEPLIIDADDLCIRDRIDFALGFWMVHEVPDQLRLFKNIKTAMRNNGRFLMVEPQVHVRKKDFERSVAEARISGMIEVSRPRVLLSRAVLFGRG